MNHKFWNAGGGKPEGITHAVKNAEAVTIPAGVPVAYAMNGTDDGLAVVLAATSGANFANFVAGITTKAIEPGKLGEVQVYGFSKSVKLARATRAATNAAWPTMAAAANGITLGVDTALNAVSAGAASMLDPFIVLAEAVAAGPTLASNAGSGTVYLQAVRTFLRFM